MKTALSTIYVFLAIPGIIASLFITHELLEAVVADRLLWFLYWALVPVTLTTAMLQAVIRKLED